MELVSIEAPRGRADAAGEAGEGSAAPGRAILALAARAIRDFGLIAPGDRVAVGVSGGKDSLLLAVVLRELARRGDLDFTFSLVHLDQHQPGFERARFDAALARLGFGCEVVSRDTWSVVASKLKPGQIPCALCGRMRRGILNQWCAENGFTRLALGHHLDDAVETFFLNLLYGRRLDPLKPATPSEREPVVTIRPLILVEERRIRAWVARHGIDAVPCPVCDTVPDSKRRDLKALVDGFRAMQPDVDASVREALYGIDGRSD
ncbi:MAG: ATP-binding protein [bacterium]